MKPSISWLAMATLFFAAPALCMPADTELTYSYPKGGTIEREPVPFVQLGFGGPVDMVTVEITDPKDTRTQIYNAATDLVPMAKNAMFAITLPTSLDAPGNYRINYTITATREDSTSKTTSGSFGFTIDLPKQESADGAEPDDTATSD